MTTEHIRGQNGVGKYFNDPDKVKAGLARTLAGAAETWKELYGEISLPLPVAASVVNVSKTESPVEKPSIDLNQAISELRANPFSPEAVTKFWKAKLQADGRRIELDISVPDCNWREDEIKKPMVDKKGKEVPSMMVYVPQEFTGKEGLIKLGQMYPRLMNSSVQGGTTVQDSHDANKEGGWVKVEKTVDAPNLNTTQGDLEKHAMKQGYSGQRENTYILASQASKDLIGQYLDEGSTWSRLLGSRLVSRVVNAYCNSDGHLHVHWNQHPQDHNANRGGRFEEVKKA